MRWELINVFFRFFIYHPSFPPHSPLLSNMRTGTGISQISVPCILFRIRAKMWLILVNAECRMQNAELRVTSFQLYPYKVLLTILMIHHRQIKKSIIIYSLQFTAPAYSAGNNYKVIAVQTRDHNSAFCILHFSFYI